MNNGCTSANVASQATPFISENRNGCVSGESDETQADNSTPADTAQLSELDEDGNGKPVA